MALSAKEDFVEKIIEKIEVEKIDEGIKVLEGDIEVSFETEDNYKKFMNNISKYAKIKSLNRYILNQIIDKIYVYDKEEIDGQISQKVEIHYKFIGKLN